MSSLHYFANRYRNRVSRKREFFNLYKTVFVILNMQKSHKISLFKILQLFYHVASQTSSIFTCNTCTKSRGLFSGYFSAAYAFRTLILLTFGRSFQRVPWHTKSTRIIVFSPLKLPWNAVFCKVLSAFQGIVVFFSFTTFFAKKCKMKQITSVCSSQIVVSLGGADYCSK